MTDLSEVSVILDRMAQARVLCVGDLMLDHFVTGAVKRVSPEAPIPVLAVSDEAVMIGGAGNVVRNLVAFGAEAVLAAVIGDDNSGRELTRLLAETPGATAHLVTAKDRRTTIKTRFLAAGQQLLRADYEADGALAAADRAALLDHALAALADCAALALSDYGKGALDAATLRTLIDAARAAGKPVIVDPKGTDYRRYAGATLLTPNRAELALAAGANEDDGDNDEDATVVAACRRIIADCGVDGVLATRSERGMTLVTGPGTEPEAAEVADAAIHHLPARARAVFDVSGAGDTVVAAMAAAMAIGAPAPAAARFANTAAGVAVGKVGTAAAYAPEILTALHEAAFLTGEAKIVPPPAARDRVAAWRRQGLRIGFTNGCFDLLHPGHISLLNQARAACDRLVVGLNSDDSVVRLKGPGRPVQNESGRAAVLASLASVDLVVTFAQDTPLELITALRPDVLVKGADYAPDAVVGAAEVRSWGGTVMLADILDGHSTTATLQRIAP